MIRSYEELYEVIVKLRSDDGCPWDRAQTMKTLDSLFLEECYELSDAIRADDLVEIAEELGDVTFMLLLMGHIAQQEQVCDLALVYKQAKEKLIFRHPHVFGDTDASTEEDVIRNWELLKKKEKSQRSSIFDGIPVSLPSDMRFDKLMRKLNNNNQDIQEYKDGEDNVRTKLKDFLIDLSKEGHSISDLLKDINSEIENKARDRGL